MPPSTRSRPISIPVRAQSAQLSTCHVVRDARERYLDHIHVTPDGKFLHGAERKTSMLIGYKIDPDNGTLTQIGRFPTEKTPRGFAIDQASGELKPIGHYAMGTQPNWIEIVDLK